MTRNQYLAAVIRLYRELPDTPNRERRTDWAIAATFWEQKVPLPTLAHAMRLAVLRRHLRDPSPATLEPISSLAYFRRVLDHLPPPALNPNYVDYIKDRFAQLLQERQHAPRPSE